MRDVPGDSPYHLAMDRRRFLLTSLGALFGTSLVAEAQPAGKVYRIGFLALIPGENTTLMKALQERLHELGYVEGKNLIFEYEGGWTRGWIKVKQRNWTVEEDGWRRRIFGEDRR
jgi:hypothetical protein